MKHVLTFIAAGTLCVAPRIATSQSAADSAAIRATALDYVEGWYEGNAERMGPRCIPS